MLKYRFLFLFLFVCMFSYGQEVASLIFDDFKRVELIIDNDLFYTTDYYYTEGIEINYTTPNLSNFFLFKVFSAPNKNRYDAYGIGAEHKMFTPIDKNNTENLNGDRPFSSYFLINMHKETRKYQSKSSNYFQIAIGLLGNISGGKEIQNFVHRQLPGVKTVQGWESQIKNDFLLDVLYDFKKGIVHSKYFDWMVQANAEAGTLKNNIGIGSYIRLGRMPDYYFQNIGRKNHNGKHFFIYSEIDWKSRWIIYDATLSGGIFNRKNDEYVLKHSEIEDFVHQIDLSLIIRYKGLQLSYVNTFLSREIKEGLAHKYGSLRLSCDF